jgi:hypothetical protein
MSAETQPSASIVATLHLDALRLRAEQLRAKLIAFHDRLASTPPGNAAAWPEVLSMFGVLSAQLAALGAELPAEARYYALHPTATAELGTVATPWWRETVLPLMLMVRLEPAQEAEAADLTASYARLHADETLEALQRRVELHNMGLRRSLETLQARRAEAMRADRASSSLRKTELPASSDAVKKNDAAKLLAAAQWGTGLEFAKKAAA